MNDKMLGAAALAGVGTGAALLGLVGLRGLLSGAGFRASAREAFGISTLAAAVTFGATLASTSFLHACPRTSKRLRAG